MIAVAALKKSLTLLSVVNEWNHRKLDQFRAKGTKSTWSWASRQAYSKKMYLVDKAREEGAQELEKYRIERDFSVSQLFDDLKKRDPKTQQREKKDSATKRRKKKQRKKRTRAVDDSDAAAPQDRHKTPRHT